MRQVRVRKDQLTARARRRHEREETIFAADPRDTDPRDTDPRDPDIVRAHQAEREKGSA
jgi:hypothetical protein